MKKKNIYMFILSSRGNGRVECYKEALEKEFIKGQRNGAKEALFAMLTSLEKEKYFTCSIRQNYLKKAENILIKMGAVNPHNIDPGAKK